MTKTYIKPETLIIEVDTQSLMTPASINAPTNSGTVSDDFVPEGTGGEAKGFGFGFFEEEEISEE